jgi:hypothetical protein
MVLIGAALAAFSFCASVGEIFESSNPPLAMAIGVGDRAQARLNFNLYLMAAGKLKPTDPRLTAAAKRAIAVQPLNTTALQTMAAAEFQSGRTGASLGLARMTEKLSRRELGAQLILFRDALLRSDLPAAFAQLDQAMRTAGDRRTMLFPPLTQGLKIAEFRRGLVPVIDQRHDWVSEFLIYAVDEGGAAADVAQLFPALAPATRTFLAPTLAGRTITRLTDANQVDAARNLFAALPGKDLATLSDARIDKATLDPELGSFGWTLEQGSTLTARVVQGNGPGSRAVLIDVGPGETAPALSRILFMPAGNYTFSAKTRTEGSSGQISLQWIVRCLGGLQPRVVWNSGQGSALTVPADCPSQSMQLLVAQDGAFSYGQLLVTETALTRR